MWSMTGFGKSTGVFNGKKYTIEIRSLNGKTLDLSIKIPVLLRDLELQIRKHVQEKLERGKIDFFIFFEEDETKEDVSFNQHLAKRYLAELKSVSVAESLSMDGWASALVSLPGIVKQTSEPISTEEHDFLLGLTQGAIDETIKFRAIEGLAIKNDLLFSLDQIALLLDNISAFEQERILAVRNRLEGLVKEIKKEDVDASRIEQELLFYIDKLDISEEKQRLKSHISFFKETADTTASCGRKLGFIGQEIGREINTLGSKSNHAQMQRSVVEMKNFLEKIKEQIQNVL